MQLGCKAFSLVARFCQPFEYQILGDFPPSDIEGRRVYKFLKISNLAKTHKLA